MSATEHLDVLVIGAGIAGISAGHHIQADAPWASYAIFEARPALGGTWDLFRYPGIRSDSDMFTLGFSFRPWDGRKAIADGDDILRYLQETARVEGIDQHIRFHHKVVAANWSSEDACWHVTAQRSDTDETVELTAGFIYSCTGYYRYDQGYLPDFPGMEKFEGQIIHPQQWPNDLDYDGKRVVVIGSGATAITLVPALAERASHVTMLQRSPTYIASMPAVDPIANLVRRVLPSRISGPLLRWVRAIGTQATYTISQARPDLVKRFLMRTVKRQLPKGYDVEKHFSPRYGPWDQRLCLSPSGSLFKAISSGKATVVTDHVDTFTERGIALTSGDKVEADIVVTATGLEMLFVGGVKATVDGAPVDVPSKLVYKGMMLEDVPNFAVAIGYTNASWTLKIDLTSQYVARLLNRMHDTGMRQCTPVNDDPSVTELPLLALSSGYITRAADQFPKQGNKFPWQVPMSYLRDYRALKMSGIDDAVRFTNPVPSAKVSAGA